MVRVSCSWCFLVRVRVVPFFVCLQTSAYLIVVRSFICIFLLAYTTSFFSFNLYRSTHLPSYCFLGLMLPQALVPSTRVFFTTAYHPSGPCHSCYDSWHAVSPTLPPLTPTTLPHPHRLTLMMQQQQRLHPCLRHLPSLDICAFCRRGK